MQIVFWISAILLAYTVAGYPLLAYLRFRLWPQTVKEGDTPLSFSIIMPGWNVAQILPRKLENLFSIWHEGLEQVIFVSDGSTDGTNGIVREWAKTHPVRGIVFDQHQGKAAALNAGMAECRSDVIVFMDVRQVLEAEAIHRLLAPFHDERVGAVSGALMIGTPESVRHDGETIKMGLENLLRQWEGGTNTLIGVTGAFHAARRSLVQPIPAGLILDDMFIPLSAIRKGFKVAFASGARAWDDIQPTMRAEYRRKIRTLTGNYQLIRHCPWLLSPTSGVFFEFYSHKVLRLLMPFLLIVNFVSAILLGGWLYTAIYGMELAMLTLGVLFMLGWLPRWFDALGSMAATFFLLNAAAFVSFFKSLRGRFDTW